jgi:hypothetical protein
MCRCRLLVAKLGEENELFLAPCRRSGFGARKKRSSGEVLRANYFFGAAVAEPVG